MWDGSDRSKGMEKILWYCAANNLYTEEREIMVRVMTIREEFFRWMRIRSIPNG